MISNAPTYAVGDTFNIQFVWQIPAGDYLRAVFAARVVRLDTFADRYIIDLEQLVAGRQESEDGQPLPREAYAEPYWQLVGELIKRRAAVAYETADGQPVKLRLSTLTREHKFFTRFDEELVD